MDKSEFATLETRVAAAAQHACQALLAMESLRHSTDPQHQTALTRKPLDCAHNRREAVIIAARHELL